MSLGGSPFVSGRYRPRSNDDLPSRRRRLADDDWWETSSPCIFREARRSQQGEAEDTAERSNEGFDDEQPRTGFGLLTMKERAEALGGKLRVDSRRGRGTEVELEL